MTSRCWLPPEHSTETCNHSLRSRCEASDARPKSAGARAHIYTHSHARTHARVCTHVRTSICRTTHSRTRIRTHALARTHAHVNTLNTGAQQSLRRDGVRGAASQQIHRRASSLGPEKNRPRENGHGTTHTTNACVCARCVLCTNVCTSYYSCKRGTTTRL